MSANVIDHVHAGRASLVRGRCDVKGPSIMNDRCSIPRGQDNRKPARSSRPAGYPEKRRRCVEERSKGTKLGSHDQRPDGEARVIDEANPEARSRRTRSIPRRKEGEL